MLRATAGHVANDEESSVLRYIGGVVIAAVLLAGCGSDDPASTLSPSASTPSQTPTAATATPVSPSVPTMQPSQEAVVPPQPEQVVPSVPPGEPVELQFPPLSEQPAPGTDQGVPVNPDELGPITCETVCTSTGCEQYQFSVLGCP